MAFAHTNVFIMGMKKFPFEGFKYRQDLFCQSCKIAFSILTSFHNFTSLNDVFGEIYLYVAWRSPKLHAAFLRLTGIVDIWRTFLRDRKEWTERTIRYATFRLNCLITCSVIVVGIWCRWPPRSTWILINVNFIESNFESYSEL